MFDIDGVTTPQDRGLVDPTGNVRKRMLRPNRDGFDSAEQSSDK